MNNSEAETLEHIRTVNIFILRIATRLIERAQCHDNSKLKEPEKSMFDEVVGKLKGLTYDSDEYKKALAYLKPALDHHYKHNSHHPEYYENGVSDMCLVDIVEMFCDWCAATHRHNDGDICRSVDQNKERFDISGQLCKIFKTTANKHAMGKNN